MMRAGLALALVLTAAAAAPRAAADEQVPAVEIAGAVSAADDESPVFFGPAGQIYEPAPSSLTWRRRSLGGVATQVAGIVRAASGALFAAGEKTPLFRRQDGLWYAHDLPNRGRAVLALGGGVPALGIGRHVYVLRGDAWTRRGRVPGEIVAIWAGARDRVYVATEAGKLFRQSGQRAAPVRHPLDRDDRIESLIGRPGQELYAVATSGAVLRVGTSRAPRARRPASLADLRIDAVGYLPDGTPALAGRVKRDGESSETEADAETAVLVALRGGALALEAWLPLVPAGDRVAAIGSRSGAAIVATRRGLVAVRDGDEWQEGRVSDAQPDVGASRGGESAPARSP